MKVSNLLWIVKNTWDGWCEGVKPTLTCEKHVREKNEMKMFNLPHLVVTILVFPLATPSLYSSKDQVHPWLIISWGWPVWIPGGDPECWQFPSHPGGAAPCLDGRVLCQLVRETFSVVKKDQKLFSNTKYSNTQVRLLSEPFAHFQGAGDRDGKLARSHPGLASF